MKWTKLYPGAIGIMAFLALVVSAFAGIYGEEATASAFKFAVAAAMPTLAMALIFARRSSAAGGSPDAFALVIMAFVPIAVLLQSVGISPLLELLADDAVGPTAMFEGFGMGLIGSTVAVGMAYATADRDES